MEISIKLGIEIGNCLDAYSIWTLNKQRVDEWIGKSGG